MSKPSRGVFNTEMCVRCLRRKAHWHTGHVLVGQRRIAAGWCGKCLGSVGFVGHWLPAMNPAERKPAPRTTDGKGR